ncbi:MAG: SurA N-terminal domain-containing protein [Roseburia sp.]|nr:SurA N-terminal domain-containing protein [Roseburia sp.]
MATLEKIRNKSVLLFVIIIVALLAFILGDFLNSGQTYFGSGTTVAKAGGVSVQYPEYQNRMTEISEQYRNQHRDVSSDQVSGEAIQQLVAEGLIKNEYERLGIVVTDAELAEAMYGTNQSPLAAQMIANLSQALRLSAPDAAAVHEAISNPVRYGITQEDANQIAAIWTNTENQLEEEMLSQKFGRLMSGLFTYNNLDAQATYNDIATTRRIAYAVKDASTVSDSDIEFSDADVQALWNQRRGQYAVDEEMRQVNYIYIAIEPDLTDRINAENAVENALLGLNETEGLEAVSADTRFVIENGSAPASAIANRALRSFVDTAAVGQAVTVQRINDQFVLAKLLAKRQGIDSLNVTFAYANPAANVNLDSIAALINGGATVASLTASGNVAGADSIWQSLVVEGMPQELVASLTDATIGSAYVYRDSIAGDRIFKVNKRNAPVAVYDYATATLTVDPSQRTLDSLVSNLRTYVSNHSSASEFTDSAALAGYSILTDEVGASSTRIGNVADSRRYIKWVMDADKGQVSPVFQDDNQRYIIAMAVDNIYDDYRPYNSPRLYAALSGEARDAKKAAHLLSTYAGQGTDLASYASAMNAPVAEGDVNITSPFLLSLGMNESELSGAIAAAAEGEFVGPVQGKHAILVFEVRNVNTANRPYNEEEYGRTFLRNYMPQRNPLALLLGRNKVDNRSLNFIANPAE